MCFDWSFSLLQNVGLVPLADVNANIPTNVEVVGLNIGVVVVADIHRACDLIKKLDNYLVAELAAIVIRVDLDIIADICIKTQFTVIRSVLGRLIHIADEVKGTGLDIEGEGITVGRESALDAIPLEDFLDA